MNSVTESHPCSAPAAPARPPGIFQRLVVNALRGMRRGRLWLVLPDGTRVGFGAADGAGPEPGAGTPPSRPSAHAVSAGTRASRLQGHAGARAAEIHVRRADFFRRCVLHGDIGFAEAYLDGDWDSPDVTAVIAWFLLNLETAPTLSGGIRSGALNLFRAVNRLSQSMRPNTRRTAPRNIREHYDLSNEFFQLWLDPSMMYSSGRWPTPHLTLAQAQHAKNEALCRQLQLSPADHVLEIGTGWGGWALQAAREYGCRVTSLTLSPRQYEFAVSRVADAGLAHKIEVRLQDYRDLPEDERFDKLVSIEMLEAVGHRFLPEWCRVASRALKPQGLMALQLITCPDARYDQFRGGVDFIQKHIFPGSLLLSVNRLNHLLASEGGFQLHRLEDFGPDYARTLRRWRETFAARWEEVRVLGFDERFRRKWTYYLCYCEAAFAMRNISVVQTVHTRPNNLSLAS